MMCPLAPTNRRATRVLDSIWAYSFSTSCRTRSILRPELQFSSRYTTESYRKSLQLGDTTTSQTADITRSQTYLELPLILGYQVSEKFSLHLGPAFGFLLGSKITTTGNTTVTTPGGTTTTSLDNSLSTTDGLRPVEIAGVVGAAYRFGGRLEIGLRYWRGFTTLEEVPICRRPTRTRCKHGSGMY